MADEIDKLLQAPQPHSAAAFEKKYPSEVWRALEDVRYAANVLRLKLDPARNPLDPKDPEKEKEKRLLLDVRAHTRQLDQAYHAAKPVKPTDQNDAVVTLPEPVFASRLKLAQTLSDQLVLMARHAGLHGLMAQKRTSDGEQMVYTGPTFGPAYHSAWNAVLQFEEIQAKYRVQKYFRVLAKKQPLIANPKHVQNVPRRQP